MALQTFTAGQVLTAAQLTTLQANAYNQTVSNKVASYVLVAADRGTRVVMNNAGATTITVNSGLFTAGDTLFIQNIGAGTCTITAGTCTVNTSGSLALAQWGGGTLYFTSASAAIFFSSGVNPYGTATGGTGVVNGPSGYQYTSFIATGTLTITKAGLFDIYIFAGGGGGGSTINTAIGGGGGAGGGYLDTVYFDTNQTITVGGGGAAGGGQGVDSKIQQTSLTVVQPAFVYGGGYGGGYWSGAGQAPSTGGSGGGGGFQGTNQGAATLSSLMGFAGGNAFSSSAGGGGGGGVGAVGGNGTSTVGGAGGAGVNVSTFIGGSSLFKGGGGGGGGTTGGAGGSGVGGAGGSLAGTAAAANTGSGGGGANSAGTNAGGNGGSGIVYIRWKV